MKLYLLVFYLAYCGCFKNDGVVETFREEDWDYDKDLKLIGLRENDKEIIYRPCHLHDIDCIRKFFAKNSQCSIVKGPAPDPLIFERNTVYLPYSNMTVLLKNVQISGLNDAEMKEFYVNEDTGNLVFAIDVKGLSERSTYSSFKFQRTAKESIVLSDYTTFTYELITFTAVIPKVPNLQLHRADIYANIADGNPLFIVGPNAYNSSDPTVQRAYIEINAALPTAFREAFLLKSSLYLSVFIQYNICDFGIKIISV